MIIPMKQIMQKTIRHLWIPVLFAAGISLMGQEVRSNKVPFMMNNLPEEKGPVITILSPGPDGDLKYITDAVMIGITGRVQDENGVEFLAVSSRKVEISREGLFSVRINLFPGENRIRITASDRFQNLQEKTVTIEYRPPGVPEDQMDLSR